MISKKQKILRLENELKSKNEEIAMLHDQLAKKYEKGVCKSEFCLVCKHYMGTFGGEFINCSKHDKAPCKDFEFDDINVNTVVKHNGKTIYKNVTKVR